MINYKTYRLFACNRISACVWNLPFFIGLSLIVGACATGPATKTPKATTSTPGLSGKETLLTIDSTPVAVEEFLYVYNKNNNDSIQYVTSEERDKALRDYLDLFINFKLKVKAAKAEGLDQSQGFKKELARYQKQLAKPFLIENQVTEQLVQEAYARLQQEVHASHILIELGEDASPADTLKAYHTIDSLRNLAQHGDAQHGDAQHGDAQQGVPFDKLARENSGDPSAAMNGGDLGYFTALQMVYPFENAAYNTPVGKISLPVRSQFGYHIVKVHDRRPARGKVKVAHIMLRLAPNASPEEETKIRDKAVEIYQQLQKGSDWNELCERFSEDVSTKSAGGSLPYFGTGSMLGAFEEAAFALNNKGDISEPVRTQFGWHILKLEDKKPVDSLEKLRPELERKIAQSVRSEVLRKDMVSKLKKENNFLADPQVVQSILQGPSGNEVNTTIANPKTTLFTLNDTAYNVGSFYRYAEEKEGNHQDGNTDMNKLYNSFVEEQVLAYEEAHLAEKHDAYRLLLNEYYDGILLFEMMEKEVWAKATKDTVGLQNFFDTHKTQYQWKDRVAATIFEVPNEGVATQLQKSLSGKKFPLDEDTRKGLEKSFTEKGTNIGIFYGTYEKGQTRYTTAEKVIDKVNWTKGETQITANGKVYLLKIHEVLPPSPKKLSEIRGIVIADYQNHLEKEWVDSLKQVYVINVNEDVLQKVIHSLQ